MSEQTLARPVFPSRNRDKRAPCLCRQLTEEKRALDEEERRASEEYIQRLLAEEEELLQEDRRRREDDERLARLLSNQLVRVSPS